MNVVGTMFFKDDKLLIDKPRKRPTYQMIGGGAEENETPLQAAIRECHEELGNEAVFDENLFELIMEFDEIATSDGVTPIHFYVFKYNGELEGRTNTSDLIDFSDPNDIRYGVEPLLIFRKRITDFWDEIISNYVNKNILIVTHAGVVIYSQAYFKGEPKDGNYRNYKIKNCEILQFDNSRAMHS